ncbi:hypothetical protein ES703_98712 [subsurface metagenome]
MLSPLGGFFPAWYLSSILCALSSAFFQTSLWIFGKPDAGSPLSLLSLRMNPSITRLSMSSIIWSTISIARTHQSITSCNPATAFSWWSGRAGNLLYTLRNRIKAFRASLYALSRIKSSDSAEYFSIAL